jgi:Zn ribbon nucleic-acid-binding protein
VSTLEAVAAVAEGTDPGGHLQCPFCNSYDVSRMFLASLNLDSCECASCGARWDEECGSGEYRGRADRASVLMPRHR